jgi:hypothetical protein
MVTFKFKCLFNIFGSLPNVHIGSEKLMCHVSQRKINNIFHGNFEINSTVKLKRIETPSLKLGFYH